ncbi:hypothetical protein NXT3_PC00303 (plasmid) [Sinorhizobium fredii]|uniref:Uncharacterized protein n=1 Tax=Rhizobium fredii TaxID=380 RepID=A0A2L0HDC8_RHIFR|nr:hypothetical protein NXT3_PC00303 [Sinorhizobium fredii]
MANTASRAHYCHSARSPSTTMMEANSRPLAALRTRGTPSWSIQITLQRADLVAHLDLDSAIST